MCTNNHQEVGLIRGPLNMALFSLMYLTCNTQF